MSSSAPNAILLNQWFYKYRDFYGVQLQSKLSNFLVALNNNAVLGDVVHIMLRQFQSYYGLFSSPLLEWPYKELSKSVVAYFLPALVSLCSMNDFFYEIPDQHKHIILGGSEPLCSSLTTHQLIKTRRLRAQYNIIYKSQLMEPMTRLPVSWASFCQLE